MNMTDAVYILSRQPCKEAGGAAALPSVWNHLRMRRYEMTWHTKRTKVKHSQLFTNTLKQFSHMHCSSKPFPTLLTGEARVNNCANQECFKNDSIL